MLNPVCNRLFFAVLGVAFPLLTLADSNMDESATGSNVASEGTVQPEARADALGTFQDASLMVSTDRLLANDTNPNGGTLVVTQVVAGGNPNSGAVSLVGTTVTYSPKAGYLGQDTFTYSISDGAGGVSVGSVVVTIGSKSSFKITAITKSGVQVNLGGTAIPGGYYVVQVANGVAGPFSDFTGSFQPAPDGTFHFSDFTQPPPVIRFYRLRVSN